MKQEAGVGQAEAVCFFARRIDQRASRGAPAGAEDLYGRTDEFDHVMYHVAALDVTAGRGQDEQDRLVADSRIRQQLSTD